MRLAGSSVSASDSDNLALLDHKWRSRKPNRKKWKCSDSSESDLANKLKLKLKFRRAYDSAYDSAHDSDFRFSLVIKSLTTPTPSLVKTSLKPARASFFFGSCFTRWFSAEASDSQARLPATVWEKETRLDSKERRKSSLSGSRKNLCVHRLLLQRYVRKIVDCSKSSVSSYWYSIVECAFFVWPTSLVSPSPPRRVSCSFRSLFVFRVHWKIKRLLWTSLRCRRNYSPVYRGLVLSASQAIVVYWVWIITWLA